MDFTGTYPADLAEKILIKGSVVARHIMDGDATSARVAIAELRGYLDAANTLVVTRTALGWTDEAHRG